MSAPPPVVELNDVSKSYAEGDAVREVLAGTSLTLHAGEFVVLLGRSGSGKSTLLNLISGIDLPSRGTVRVAGQELGALSEHARTLLRRERIGFIFQSFNLMPDLNVYDNVDVPLRYRRMKSAERDKRITNALEIVGLAARMKHLPAQLSGGQQQRVAIARAIAGDPKLVLADEYTCNLDSLMARQVMDLL